MTTETTSQRGTVNIPDAANAEEVAIEMLKAEGLALDVLNQTLADRNRPNSVKAFTVWLDKPLAEYLLKFNLHHPIVTNRPLNEGVVTAMARQILAGHFRNTGEPLLFTDRADGIDLQHRCHAVLRAAAVNPEAGYETTVLTGVHVNSVEDLVSNLLVMGTAKRSLANLAHFANVDTHKWQTVEYYLLPDDIKPGRINKALSKLEINDEYKSKREYYDATYDTMKAMFNAHRDHNMELGEKRLPIYVAAALKMFDVDAEKGTQFMQAFFNPLENDLPKGNPVDAMRTELVTTFATQQRDKTRPIFIRRAMLRAFQEFADGHLKTKWQPFIHTMVAA